METGTGQRKDRTATARLIAVITIAWMGFEVYSAGLAHIEHKTGLAPNIGNFERTRKLLEDRSPQDKFSFAVVGDTRANRTFERLCDELRNEPLSFMVILGDFVESGTTGNHDFFEYECRNEYRLPFPVFIVAGNHDVECEASHDAHSVSLNDLERMYGPRDFCFEYDGCLFVGLCILPAPFSTDRSLAFLESTLAAHRSENRKVFVFTHVPPFRSTGPIADFENAQAFMDVIDRYKVDYFISAHFHGYDRNVRNDTVYLVSGGGGGRLDETETFHGLHHAIVLTVDHDTVSERTILAPQSKGKANAVRHFALAELAPFLREHAALTVIENGLLLAVLGICLGKCIGGRGRLRRRAIDNDREGSVAAHEEGHGTK